MKRINLLLKAILIFVVAANIVCGNDWDDTKSKSFKVNKGGTLNVELNSGEIIVQTWDKDEVLVNVSGLSNDAFKALEMSLNGNTLTVTYENEYDEDSEDISFSFTVPAQFNLDLKTLAGDVKFKNNVSGNVTVDTYGGDIKSTNINGNVKLETKGGDIKLGDISGDCNLNTYGGDISVGIISGKNAKVSTNGGDVKIKKSSAGVSVKTYGGEITVGDLGGDSELITYGGDVIAGSVNGSVKMETYGGNLTLNGAKGKVKGKTNGGDIKFRNIDGSVDLKTMAGTVSVELNPAANSESRISNNSGSIELLIPQSAKATIEARIHVQGWWKNAKDTYKIDSDFSAKSSSMDENNKDILEKYEVNGGGGKIFLRTVNDNIQIKKSN